MSKRSIRATTPSRVAQYRVHGIGDQAWLDDYIAHWVTRFRAMYDERIGAMDNKLIAIMLTSQGEEAARDFEAGIRRTLNWYNARWGLARTLGLPHVPAYKACRENWTALEASVFLFNCDSERPGELPDDFIAGPARVLSLIELAIKRRDLARVQEMPLTVNRSALLRWARKIGIPLPPFCSPLHQLTPSEIARRRAGKKHTSTQVLDALLRIAVARFTSTAARRPTPRNVITSIRTLAPIVDDEDISLFNERIGMDDWGLFLTNDAVVVEALDRWLTLGNVALLDGDERKLKKEALFWIVSSGFDGERRPVTRRSLQDAIRRATAGLKGP